MVHSEFPLYHKTGGNNPGNEAKTMYIVQWSPSNLDTLGPQKVSRLVGCLDFRG